MQTLQHLNVMLKKQHKHNIDFAELKVIRQYLRRMVDLNLKPGYQVTQPAQNDMNINLSVGLIFFFLRFKKQSPCKAHLTQMFFEKALLFIVSE